VDRNLLQAARNGDRRAYEALGRWLFAELAVFFKRHPAHESDELIQETTTEILGSLSSAADDPVAFRDFVRGYAGTRSLTRRRDAARDHERIVLGSHPAIESPSVTILGPLIDAIERQQVIDHAQRLQPIFRDAILHVLDGGTYRSLAASKNIPEQTAWSRVERAIELVSRSIDLARRTPPPYRTPATPAGA
jgi:DNA-directed RNA polymerase specialized sigma24 family protein